MNNTEPKDIQKKNLSEQGCIPEEEKAGCICKCGDRK